jgi:ATP-dependent DNA helicase RecG
VAGKTKFNARALMERAIAVMRETEHEPRGDGKAVPLVGVVIYKPDGTIETAYRGEIRDGDHAEYTLLERKNRSNRLDNSILFTTLEPCAPGARSHSKLSCSERIVLARIKEVWIGIEDPDPMVDRKGIEYLRKNEVTVHMFDRDLQEIISEENKDFIEQAVQRAEEEESGISRKEIVLSGYEKTLESAELRDLSQEVLEKYRIRAKITDPVESSAFKHRLVQLGLLIQKNGGYVPSGFGYMVFGKEPRTIVPQAGLIATIHYPDGSEEQKEFNEPLVTIPESAIEWLSGKLPNIIDRSTTVRGKKPAFPPELIREALVNALVHRDYNIEGAKCQLIVTEHTITVKSPGSPLPPITLDQMKSFNAPMLSRNPQLHYVFRQMGLAEEAGLGLKTFRATAERYELPLPKYTFEDPYLVLTLFRTKESAAQTLSPAILESLNGDERAGWEFLSSRISTTQKEYAEHMGFEHRKAQRHLKKFFELGLITRRGAGPSTEYLVMSQ